MVAIEDVPVAQRDLFEHVQVDRGTKRNHRPNMAKNEKTSKSVASKASKILSNPKSTKAQKSVAASALTQAAPKKSGKK
jgi:hypothetical protein